MTTTIKDETKLNKNLKIQIKEKKETAAKEAEIVEAKEAQFEQEEKRKLQRAKVEEQQRRATSSAVTRAQFKQQRKYSTVSAGPSSQQSFSSSKAPQGRTDDEILLAVKRRFSKKDRGITLSQFNNVRKDPSLLKKHYKSTPKEIVVNTPEGQVLVHPIKEDGVIVDFELLGEVSNKELVESLVADQLEIEKEKKQVFEYIKIQEELAQARE